MKKLITVADLREALADVNGKLPVDAVLTGTLREIGGVVGIHVDGENVSMILTTDSY